MNDCKHPPISIHQTLSGQLEVDWRLKYHQEYNCPICNKGPLTKYYHQIKSSCKLCLSCDFCQKRTYLICPVLSYISNYLPEIGCPNPLCKDIGPNQQKGWVYKTDGKSGNYKCHFCKIYFNPNSVNSSSWLGCNAKKQLKPFFFDEDIWELRHFYSKQKTSRSKLDFTQIYPEWYRQHVKRYSYHLLKSNIFSSGSRIQSTVLNLKQFRKIIINLGIQKPCEIDRNTILQFLNGCKNNKSNTINAKLVHLRGFFDWLDIETSSLIRNYDFLKTTKNDPEWLDELTRNSIKQYLETIPVPIAHQYLVQNYLAARPEDICKLAFDCLEENNGQWYINFFQNKTKRWHKILANRQIRKVIEEQQQWIRKTFGLDYSYLFCHFWNIQQRHYPNFSNIRPLPIHPPVDVNTNPMVRIIRMLIDKENILDSNGQKPHFTGKITRSSRLQEVRAKYGMEAARLYADHKSSTTTFQHYAPPTREQIAEVDLPFQELLMNPDNEFLPWQSLPESLLKNPKAHELDLEISPRLVVYGHCTLDSKTPCIYNLYPKCYGCSSFRPSTGKLPLYERQYQGEQQRLTDAEKAGAELASEEAKATIESMDKWLPELRRLADG